eukprot:2455681-Rhodomonas_salina.1
MRAARRGWGGGPWGRTGARRARAACGVTPSASSTDSSSPRTSSAQHPSLAHHHAHSTRGAGCVGPESGWRRRALWRRERAAGRSSAWRRRSPA